jgi:hypothetical protein
MKTIEFTLKARFAWLFGFKAQIDIQGKIKQGKQMFKNKERRKDER